MTNIYFKIVLILIPFASCDSNTQKTKDDFYTYSRQSYLLRLPLVRPYELISPDNGGSWILNYDCTHHIQPCFLTHVGMSGDSMILSYTNSPGTNDCNELWFVIDIIKKKDTFFTSKKEYLTYLKTIKIKDVKLYSINGIYKVFDTAIKLPSDWCIADSM